MNPLFSIITVCLNEGGTIEQTCESIVSQTCENYEWIVIDGASTDASLAVLDQYRHRITHLKSEPDEGIFDAMNKGVAMAKGDYLVFMNGGDQFASEEVLQWVAEMKGPNLIYGDAHHDSLEGPLATYPDELPKGYFLKNTLPHQATYYHRSLFEKYGLYDTSYRIAGDYDLHVRLHEVVGIDHRHIPKPLAIYRLAGISSDPHYRKLRKLENHRVRMRYFTSYRWSPKAWRQSIRNLIARF